jgi:type VI secretion system protein ImpK
MRLSDCFVDLVAYMSYFRKSAAKRQPPYDKVRADVHRLLAQSQECVKRGLVSDEEYREAHFAVCAWVDEAILSSSWQEKGKWTREQLQRLHYQTTDAGEEFFERLNRLGPAQTGAREVYYLCLAMGFTGRYHNQGDEFLLEQLKTSNLKLLSGSSLGLPTLERGELFPEAYPPDSSGGATPQRKAGLFSVFTLASLAGPVVLFLVLFVIYRFALSGIGDNILSRIP